jgi:choline kinase
LTYGVDTTLWSFKTMSSIVHGKELPCALILAAGVGRRLGEGEAEHPHHPKALLEFGGKTLLARHVGILHAAGIGSITVIIGYMADSIRAELVKLTDGPSVSMLVNPDFREGSIVSLWAGRRVLRTGGPVILMDADVLYDRRLMARLLATSLPNCLLLDRGIEPGDEPVKICVRDGRIVDFHKRPSLPYDWHGESVGFFRLSPTAAAELADRTEDYVSSGRRGFEYEEPIRDMIVSGGPDSFGFEDISGLPWTEIDFHEDVLKANALLPGLVE